MRDDTQTLLELVTLKREALQSRIDALAHKEADLLRRVTTLRSQGDGLAMGEVEAGGFQRAAMAEATCRGAIARFEAERQSLNAARRDLVRERVQLDVAEDHLERALAEANRMRMRRADLKG